MPWPEDAVRPAQRQKRCHDSARAQCFNKAAQCSDPKPQEWIEWEGRTRSGLSFANPRYPPRHIHLSTLDFSTGLLCIQSVHTASPTAELQTHTRHLCGREHHNMLWHKRVSCQVTFDSRTVDLPGQFQSKRVLL